ncbi:MAG: hypothetical protein U1E41_04995 [Paracoccus sp. (in: a-proteobacteria)]
MAMTGFAGPAKCRPVATGLARKGAAPQPDARATPDHAATMPPRGPARARF